MLPSAVVGVLVLIVAVLPGSVYTWAYERQASAYGVTFADRTLRFIGVSVVLHLVLGWPEFLLYRLALTGEQFGAVQFAAAWAAVVILVALPAALGSVLGGLYRTRTARSGWRWVRSYLTQEQEARLLQIMLGSEPAPRAWDHLFSERPNAYLRVKTV